MNRDGIEKHIKRIEECLETLDAVSDESYLIECDIDHTLHVSKDYLKTIQKELKVLYFNIKN